MLLKIFSCLRSQASDGRGSCFSPVFVAGGVQLLKPALWQFLVIFSYWSLAFQYLFSMLSHGVGTDCGSSFLLMAFSLAFLAFLASP